MKTVFSNIISLFKSEKKNNLSLFDLRTQWMQSAKTKYKKKDVKSAIYYLNKIIESFPHDGEAYYSRASIKDDDMNDHEGALQDYSKAIELKPNWAEAYYGRGYSKMRLSLYNEALEDFNTAIKLKPNWAEVYFGVGVLKEEEMYNYREAITYYSKAIELNPMYAEAYLGRAESKFKIEKYEEAIKDYNRAIELNFKPASAFLNRGLSKCSIGEDGCSDLHMAKRLGHQNAARWIAFWC